jgi:acyl transferase domain-containing protein
MVEPPPDRWCHEDYSGSKSAPGKYASSKGGFVNDIDMFDPLEFGISMKEAQHLDPSLRLTLEAAHAVRIV